MGSSRDTRELPSQAGHPRLWHLRPGPQLHLGLPACGAPSPAGRLSAEPRPCPQGRAPGHSPALCCAASHSLSPHAAVERGGCGKAVSGGGRGSVAGQGPARGWRGSQGCTRLLLSRGNHPAQTQPSPSCGPERGPRTALGEHDKPPQVLQVAHSQQCRTCGSTAPALLQPGSVPQFPPGSIKARGAVLEDEAPGFSSPSEPFFCLPHSRSPFTQDSQSLLTHIHPT